MIIGGRRIARTNLYAHGVSELYTLIKGADPTRAGPRSAGLSRPPLRLEYLTRVWNVYTSRLRHIDAGGCLECTQLIFLEDINS